MAPPAAGTAARSAAPATHGGAVRPAPARRPRQRPSRPPRRVSGPAPPAPARQGTAALPVKVLDAPFARALRSRTSGVLDALLAGRGWIVLVGVLLVGIVFFNVDLLRMNREIALTAEKSTALKRENARLRQEAALLGSSERIQDAAADLGLVLPGAGDVRYLEANPAFDAQQGRAQHRRAHRRGPGGGSGAARPGGGGHADRHRPDHRRAHYGHRRHRSGLLDHR